MSMVTYVKALELHLEGDKEVGLEELKSNQRQLNGHVSMLLKVFGAGSDWQHQHRMREIMLSNSWANCPLLILYKFQQGWTLKSGKSPPTTLWLE